MADAEEENGSNSVNQITDDLYNQYNENQHFGENVSDFVVKFRKAYILFVEFDSMFLKDVEARTDENYASNALYEIEERTELKTDAQADEDDMNSRDSFSKYA